MEQISTALYSMAIPVTFWKCTFFQGRLSVRCAVCLHFRKRVVGYTSMLLSKHFFLYLIFHYNFCARVISSQTFGERLPLL